MKVINLWGEPSSGKSTLAVRLFGEMKIRGFEVELVTEVAKDMVWEESKWFGDSLWVLGNQNHRLEILRDKVDYCITDSPLPLGLLYAPEGYMPSFAKLMWETFFRYDNINLRVRRNHGYEDIGRNQNESQASYISKKLDFMLKWALPNITEVNSTSNLDEIIRTIFMPTK